MTAVLALVWLGTLALPAAFIIGYSRLCKEQRKHIKLLEELVGEYERAFRQVPGWKPIKQTPPQKTMQKWMLN